MKRDMDLIRRILLAIEGSPEPDLRRELDFPGIDYATANHHFRLLVQAGLITAVDKSSHGQDFVAVALTWRGYEYLEFIRDPERWAHVKAVAESVGSWSSNLLVEFARAEALHEAQRKGFTDAAALLPNTGVTIEHDPLGPEDRIAVELADAQRAAAIDIEMVEQQGA